MTGMVLVFACAGIQYIIGLMGTINNFLMISEPVPASFNSPYIVSRSATLIVGSSDANGEIGFSDLSQLFANEPDTGINKVIAVLTCQMLHVY